MPFQDVFGQVRITYRLFGGEQDSDPNELVLTITAVNDAPVDILLTGDRTNSGGDRAVSDTGGEYVLVDDKILLSTGVEAGVLTATDPAFGEDDVANIYPGQIAQVSLSTYDVSRYGSLEGVVQRIAQNTTQEEGMPPYYVTMIEVPNPQFSKSETPVEIATGTPTVIDIIGKKRTVLSYILTPLERAAGVAFREQ